MNDALVLYHQPMMLWHKNKWSEQPSFSRNQTRTPDLSHALPLSCNHQKTSSPRYPLYGGTKSFNCTPNRYSVCAIWTLLCGNIHLKKVHTEWYFWVWFSGHCRLATFLNFHLKTYLCSSWLKCFHIFFFSGGDCHEFKFYASGGYWQWPQRRAGIYSVFLTAAQDKHMYIQPNLPRKCTSQV